MKNKLHKHHGRLQELEDVVYPMLEAPAEETKATDVQANGRHTTESHVGIESTAEADTHGRDGQNGRASGDRSLEEDVPTEVAVDGDLPRWRRALTNVPRMIGRMFS